MTGSERVDDLVGLLNSVNLDLSTVFNEKEQFKLLLGVVGFYTTFGWFYGINCDVN